MQGLACAVLFFIGTPTIFAIENGLGQTPPMGWRSWNLFGADVNQTLMMRVMDGMVSKSRRVDGTPTSLADLGYVDIGLDDNWQICGSYGGKKQYTYHAEGGLYPVINKSIFPDMNAMTEYAHSLNLTAGWYLNNCICRDHCSSHSCYHGDAESLMSFGFDSVKLDRCGAQLDLDLWADLFEAAVDRPILIENCHWGETLPNATWCPFNVYRSSTDVWPSYASVMANLITTFPLADAKLSKPGCWAYPDMLEVGVKGLTAAEARSHFASWAIVSSPLTLSMDVNDDSVMDSIWDLIANPEIIAVNQMWYGHSGSRFLKSDELVDLGTFGLVHANEKEAKRKKRKKPSKLARKEISPGAVTGPADRAFPRVFMPAWQYLYKPVSPTSTAILLMNSARTSRELTLHFSDVPNLSCGSLCHVRDLMRRTNLGTFEGSYTVEVESHDVAFFLVESAASVRDVRRPRRRHSGGVARASYQEQKAQDAE